MAAVTRRKRRRTTLQQQQPSPPLSPATGVLPQDLMIEVLSRVPVTDPLELRCVCKWWKALVSDPQFVKNHLYRSITEINDLASKALDDMIAFELQLNYAPPVAEEEDEGEEEEEAEEEARSLRKELDNMLVVVRSLKESLETIKVDMNAIKDRMKCLQSFLQIYLKTVRATASESSSSE